MHSFLSALSQWKEYITDMEDIYSTLKKQGEPELQQVLLPFLYKHIGKDQLFKENDLAIFLGAYLGTHHPELHKYFFNEHIQQEIESIRRVLEQQCEEPHDTA